MTIAARRLGWLIFVIGVTLWFLGCLDGLLICWILDDSSALVRWLVVWSICSVISGVISFFVLLVVDLDCLTRSLNNCFLLLNWLIAWLSSLIDDLTWLVWSV